MPLMEITEEQRRRAEANRMAAIERRRRAEEAGLVNHDAWRLFKCRKIPSPTHSSAVPSAAFRVVLEICSPDEFSATPEPLQGLPFPGDGRCFGIIEESVSKVVPFRCIESQGRQRGIYMLKDYELVAGCLKKIPGVQLQGVPFRTRSVVEKFSCCIRDHWEPCVDGHYSDDKVDELLKALPNSLRDALLPYQLDGVKFGLQRGGRCLIADEMGLGKTIQAIAIACCFMEAGPLLVVCPAVLRYSWAEELEHWLPFLLPKDIHLVFGHQNNLDRLEKDPKVVVISYNMLNRLQRSMQEKQWEVMIIDESHNIRCTKKTSESGETKAILDLAPKVNHIILLSGTPSLTRPYDIYHQVNILWPRLLGDDKYEYAKNYCSMKLVHGCQGKIYKDFSKGIRFEELNVLLRQTLMIRRLKEHVLAQLPPKRRQIIRLMLKAADILFATKTSKVQDAIVGRENQNESITDQCCHKSDDGGDAKVVNLNTCHGNRTLKSLSDKEIGLAKLSGFREWFSNHSILREPEDASTLGVGLNSQKMIIFGHHLKVLDEVQEFICEKEIKFVRIDGSTVARDRQMAVEAFRSSSEVKIAIIGITAGGVGLDFSSAQNVVFLELPKSASEMLQAEDRAHRRGQNNAVNIYIFCAKDTSDESRWLQLNKSLFRVSSVINGKVDAVKEIQVDGICQLDYSINASDDARMGISSINMDVENADESKVQSIVLSNETSKRCEGSLAAFVGVDEDGLVQDNISHSDTQDYSSLGSNLEGNQTLTAKDRRSSDICGYGLDEGCEKIKWLENMTHETDETQSTSPKHFDGKICELAETDTRNRIQAESLRFEVSRYTRRIHLYVCILGEDSRPRPVFQNFRQEELESMLCSNGDLNKETAPQLLLDNSAFYEVFQAFVKEWNELRPIEQNKLHGKPLQLPLSLELCYLKDTINHGCGGLLKGGSKRRVTPLSDISHPLPEGALWKKVVLSGGHAKEKEYSQAWTITDEPLCKLCQAPCRGKLAKIPEYFEDLFCNLGCFQEYRIRTSQKALREALFQIEHGVCVNCKLDCHTLVECIRPLSVARRKEYIRTTAPTLAKKRKLFEKLVYEPVEGNAWHADHIIPVYKGGGECRLENMRTLCVVCHSEVTKAQQGERKLMRKRAKEQLKLVMMQVKGNGSTELTNPRGDVCLSKSGHDAIQDDSLFVEVPGSSYSAKLSQELHNQ
ncbi:DNA helicase protein [Dioscorea alata]|uniref:DNA helicase protein n=1 Tax=Dioscorea alata TaxID=55571 RepID=A0ACB7TWI7_DIOAL|nr:DNA helicase protein [Dioscorea alata]